MQNRETWMKRFAFVWLDGLPCLQVETPDWVSRSLAALVIRGDMMRGGPLCCFWLSATFLAGEMLQMRQTDVDGLNEVFRDTPFKIKASPRLQQQRWTISVSVWESGASSAVHCPSPSPVLSLYNFGKLQVYGTGTGKKVLVTSWWETTSQNTKEVCQ